ncbi:MAG: hypothetical protein M0C28_38050 [Candidatus Moduliflexus flocculans]|nr:hypothetical protein [Candidatus Moduliflexus flocculans]
MTSLARSPRRKPRRAAIVLTDSGLGGLSICAGLEQPAAGHRPAKAPSDLVYVNAWPDARHGYNDLPDMAASRRRSSTGPWPP